MTQADRDRLVALKKAKDKKMTQRQAGEELKISERQVRRLLAKVRKVGDQAVLHGLRGRSNRRIQEQDKKKALEIIRRDVDQGFGPTLASEYLLKKHNIEVSKETARKWMKEAGLWRARKQRIAKIHVWRARRERFGELVQCDTSTHNWLEDRGEKIYLIKMIDDATSRLFARFVRSDSVTQNMAVLEAYLLRFGRPLEFYTDKASIFVTTPKKNHPKRDEPLPPTQIGWALQRSFENARDRLVKGLRVAGAKTLEEANAYLEAEYLAEWEAKFTVVVACIDDAHRVLGKQHDLSAILSEVEKHVITNDHTIRHDTKVFQIVREDVRPRMRKASIRIETRRNGEIAVRFEDLYLRIEERQPAPKVAATPTAANRAPKTNKPEEKSKWMDGFWKRPAPSLRKAIRISNAIS